MRLFNFIKKDIWLIRVDGLPRRKAFTIRLMRTLILIGQGFTKQQIQQGASTLTYYSLFAIVPVLAFFFEIARGFLLQDRFKFWLIHHFNGDPMIINQLLDFSNLAIKETRQGVLAGFGFLIMLWAGMKILIYIESVMNQIWEVQIGRTLARRFSDYMALFFLCPLFLILSGALTVVFSSAINDIGKDSFFLKNVSFLLLQLVNAFSYVSIWLLFTFIYIFVPNTRVRFRPALYAAIVTGSLYQLVQWAYLYLQWGVSHYNTIYGTFAALPLFLIWLHMSWGILLLGAKMAFAFQNVHAYEFMRDDFQLNQRLHTILCLRIVHLCVKRFYKEEQLPTLTDLSNELEVPLTLIHTLQNQLVDAGLLIEVKHGREELLVFAPALPVEQLTIKKVIDMIGSRGEKLPHFKDGSTRVIMKALKDFSDLMDDSDYNLLLKDF